MQPVPRHALAIVKLRLQLCDALLQCGGFRLICAFKQVPSHGGRRPRMSGNGGQIDIEAYFDNLIAAARRRCRAGTVYAA
jgi:hypothetical protein